VNTVLSVIDKDNDGKISQGELQDAGLAALPNFADTEGHHYDVESGEYAPLFSNGPL
jgi:Ca2+-binding EF-hand superfamily protein